MRAPKQDILHQNELNIPKEYIRFATPAGVALYRAERLKCNVIAEIGCGIGGQTIGFAKKCKKVISIEVDKKQIKIAKSNIERLGIKNIEFIWGDALSKKVIEKIKDEKPDIVFCDTERKEAGDRSINELKPDIRKLIEKYSFCEKIAVEVPPFTSDLERLKDNYEKEFISLNSKLNRLTLYFNKLKKAEKSAVSLPSAMKIESNESEKVELTESALGFDYFYGIDPAIVLAGLIDELASHYKVRLIEINKKNYFLSKEKIDSVFLDSYKILKICNNKFETIIKELKIINAGKVVIRYNILPEEYWKERNRYENELIGKKEVHLFAGKDAILCEQLKPKI